MQKCRKKLEVFEVDLIKTECGGVEVIDLVVITPELLNDSAYELHIPQAIAQGEWCGAPVRIKAIQGKMFGEPYRQRTLIKEPCDIHRFGPLEETIQDDDGCCKERRVEIFPLRNPKNDYNFVTANEFTCCGRKNCGNKVACIHLNDAHEFILHKTCKICGTECKTNPCACRSGFGSLVRSHGYGNFGAMY